MGVTTRSASSSPVKKHQSRAATGEGKTTKTDAADGMRVLFLPKDLSPKARILSIRHPRDSSPKRFLLCPVHGLYEFTRIAQPPGEYRSLLFSSVEEDSASSEPVPASTESSKFSDGYISQDASLLVATPFDLFFFLLSILPSALAGSAKALFQPIDDLFESAIERDKHSRFIISVGRPLVEQALRKFCDTVDAGDDTMFRVSEEKTVALIHQKIIRVVERGLPPTLEERFVTRAFETPVLGVKRETSTLSTATMVIDEAEAEAEEEIKNTDNANGDSQSSAASSAPSLVFSETSTISTSTVTTIASSPEAPSPQILNLQRLKVALDFIIVSYFHPTVANHVRQHFLSSSSPIDFGPLQTHLAHLAKLKAQALAQRSLGDFSRKRGLEDDEAAEERAEKKRKQDEEEKKKKANISRGVKDLAKVNVSGMKKMSDFFAKKPAAKAKA
ncbi:uncharacterized protein AB675_7757 [Cyphellophora attinorum]|uniref:Ribonuclease H2 subunit B n=1 Tax=Cyphellophora attinorum TaxID=1664694 RepID=A0A0N1HR03_9EURO|nr:uncharacterized protein AB675_7757 [Phialophora attinorum]KPI40543.1 hypothetical protein AB675_7757 [Phialophora attinorum]